MFTKLILVAENVHKSFFSPQTAALNRKYNLKKYSLSDNQINVIKYPQWKPGTTWSCKLPILLLDSCSCLGGELLHLQINEITNHWMQSSHPGRRKPSFMWPFTNGLLLNFLMAQQPNGNFQKLQELFYWNFKSITFVWTKLGSSFFWSKLASSKQESRVIKQGWADEG